MCIISHLVNITTCEYNRSLCHRKREQLLADENVAHASALALIKKKRDGKKERQTFIVVYSFISSIWCSLVFYEPMHQDRKVNGKKDYFYVPMRSHFKVWSYRYFALSLHFFFFFLSTNFTIALVFSYRLVERVRDKCNLFFYID